MMSNYTDNRGATHIQFHGGNAETELLELELGENVAFALFHLDAYWLKYILGIGL